MHAPPKHAFRRDPSFIPKVAASSWGEAVSKIEADQGELLSMCGSPQNMMELIADCVANEVSQFLNSARSAEKTTDTVRDELLSIVSGFNALMARLPHASQFHATLNDAKLVLEASIPDTKVAPGHLAAAKRRLQGAENAKLWKLWFGSPAGCVILADADMVLAASAMDDQCEEDFMLCRKVLDEAGMPRSATTSCAGSLEFFTTGQLGLLLQDAARQLNAALRQWSPVGLDDHRSQVIATIHHIVDCASFADDVATHLLAETWHDRVKVWASCLKDKSLSHKMPLVPEDVAEAAKQLEMPEQYESFFWDGDTHSASGSGLRDGGLFGTLAANRSTHAILVTRSEIGLPHD